MRWISLIPLLWGSVVAAQPAPQTPFRPATKGLVVADVETSAFRSRFTGQAYHLYVSLPEGYAESGKRYPVLYVPDADFNFNAARTAYATLGLGRSLGMGVATEECIVVGVPLQVDDAMDWARKRFYDLTPTADEATAARYAKQFRGEVRTGGAALFLRALREEVIPYVDAHYRTTADRGLAGYSLGGLFTLWVMLQEQSPFTRYLVGSPSLWWHQGAILEAEAAFAAAGKKLRGRAFFSVGAKEGKTMLEPFQKLVETLGGRGHADLRIESRIFDGVDHLSGVAGTFSAGMKFLYAPEGVNGQRPR